jgi:hypothetical protein
MINESSSNIKNRDPVLSKLGHGIEAEKLRISQDKSIFESSLNVSQENISKEIV